jgi:hypothetical protein
MANPKRPCLPHMATPKRLCRAFQEGWCPNGWRCTLLHERHHAHDGAPMPRHEPPDLRRHLANLRRDRLTVPIAWDRDGKPTAFEAVTRRDGHLHAAPPSEAETRRDGHLHAATGGRVAAAVAGGDDAELAYDRCSQAVLPWRPPAAGWDAAFVGDALALRDLAEPARRLADDARRMEAWEAETRRDGHLHAPQGEAEGPPTVLSHPSLHADCLSHPSSVPTGSASDAAGPTGSASDAAGSSSSSSSATWPPASAHHGATWSLAHAMAIPCVQHGTWRCVDDPRLTGTCMRDPGQPMYLPPPSAYPPLPALPATSPYPPSAYPPPPYSSAPPPLSGAWPPNAPPPSHASAHHGAPPSLPSVVHAAPCYATFTGGVYYASTSQRVCYREM